MGWQARAGAQEAGQPAQAQPGTAAAPVQQTGYVDLMAGLGYTDNALLAHGQRKSDGIGTVGFNVDYKRLGNLSLDLLGNLDRLQYLKGSFGGSFYGHFYGTGILGKPTNILQWRLSDSFGEEMTNPLASPTPRNLQVINNVATGPRVNLHFGLTNRLTLFGLYSRTTYQRSPFDSQTYLGGAQFRHALPGDSSLSLRASTAHTKYVNGAAVRAYFYGTSTAYDIRRASISYDAKFVRTDFHLRAGYNTIRFGGASRHGSPLYEVRLDRQVSPFSRIFISGQQTYSTNGGSLESPGARVGLQVGASLNPGYAVAQPFNQRIADAGWLFNRARTSLSLTANYRQMIFDQTSATNNQYNHREEGVVVSLGRQLRPTVEVKLLAQGYEIRYAHLDARTRRETIRLTFSKLFSRSAIWFYIERRHQSGARGASTFQPASYNDDRVGIYFTYDLFGARSTRPSLQGMPGAGGIAGEY